MSWESKHSVKVDTPRNQTRQPDVKKRSRGIAMAGLQSQGWSLREIGDWFGVDHPEKVRRIIAAVPAEARRLRGATVRMG